MAWRLRPAAIVSRWTFVVFAGVTVGYSVWALYGSGQRLSLVDVQRLPGAAAVELSPAMNPVRIVLHVGYAPAGTTRIHYEAALSGPGGDRMWEARGTIGSRDDEATFIRHAASLGTVTVAEPGVHALSIRFGGGSMDDVREARIELRRNVARVDPRVAWGGGLLAAASLLGALLTPRRGPTFEPALPVAREEAA